MNDEQAGGTPARPHQKLTADGRRMREVLSYSRRGSRFTPLQAAAWEAHHERWVIPDEAVDEADFTLDSWFGRGPEDRDGLIVEIGSGVGEATAALAATRPSYDVLALEVWKPGAAATLALLAEAGADNVRICSVDAVWAVEHLVAPGEHHRAVDVLPRPVAQDASPQAAAGVARLRGAGSESAPSRAVSGGLRRTGRATPSRCSRCWAPSRRSRAGSSSGGTSAR